MSRCVECQGSIKNDGKHLCEECFEKQLKVKIHEDRVVESPHNSWW